MILNNFKFNGFLGMGKKPQDLLSSEEDKDEKPQGCFLNIYQSSSEETPNSLNADVDNQKPPKNKLEENENTQNKEIKKLDIKELLNGFRQLMQEEKEIAASKSQPVDVEAIKAEVEANLKAQFDEQLQAKEAEALAQKEALEAEKQAILAAKEQAELQVAEIKASEEKKAEELKVQAFAELAEQEIGFVSGEKAEKGALLKTLSESLNEETYTQVMSYLKSYNKLLEKSTEKLSTSSSTNSIEEPTKPQALDFEAEVDALTEELLKDEMKEANYYTAYAVALQRVIDKKNQETEE